MFASPTRTPHPSPTIQIRSSVIWKAWDLIPLSSMHSGVAKPGPTRAWENSALKHAVWLQCKKHVGLGHCLYVDLCFYAIIPTCLHTFWHAIPTYLFIFYDFSFPVILWVGCMCAGFSRNLSPPHVSETIVSGTVCAVSSCTCPMVHEDNIDEHARSLVHCGT